MGKRSKRERQEELWIAKRDIVETPGHVFCDRLNELLGRHRFDERVEHLCRRFYQGPYGRPSIAPGVYFRMMLVGYFEGLLAPPISLDSRLAKTAGPERKGRDGPEAEGEQGDRRS